MMCVNINGNSITCSAVDAEIIFVEEDNDKSVQKLGKRKSMMKTVKGSGQDKKGYAQSWIDGKTNKDCIKFFKSQFCTSPKYPELGPDGFILLLMTKPQIEFMKKFSERLVCVDRQKGEDFEVLSLLILDDREECLPCAFLFTNKVTVEVIKVFFTEIKNIVGKVNTKLILSEKYNGVANIWELVMETPAKNMICSWDILQDWAFNLWTVETQEKVDDTFKELEQLLEEKDINRFTSKCKALLDQLMSDSETETFGTYFAENYASGPHTWACCYRYEEEDSRGYYQLERIHSTIQYILNTKTTKKLNKALDATLDYLRNKIYDRLILINNGKVSSKLAEIKHRHKIAEKMVYEITHQNDFWSVTSRKREQNIVTLCKGNCDCQTKCYVCNVCVHTYVCSCIDSVLKLNICRHIHSVCLSEAAGETIEYGEVTGGYRFGNINSPISFSRKAKDNSSPQTSTKKTLKQNQSNKAIDTSVGSNLSLKIEAKNRLTLEDAGSEPDEEDSACVDKQTVQADLLEVVGHEVLISNQEENYEGSHITNEINNKEVIDNDGPTYLKQLQNANTSSIDNTKTFQSRITNLEQVFKTILNDVQNEEQLSKVESTMSMLQNEIKCSRSSLESHLRKRKNDEDFESVNQFPKLSKVLSVDGRPLVLGKAFVLKLDNK